MAFNLGGALALGAGTAGLDALFGGEDPAEKNLEYIKKLFAKQAARFTTGYNQQLDFGRQALAAINSGYAEAESDLSRVGGAARWDAMSRGKVQRGLAKQEAISRGTYGTSAYDNAVASANSDTERALGEIDAAVAGKLAGIKIAKAGAQADALNYIGGIFPQYAGARGNNMAMLAQILSGVQDDGSTPVSNAIGAAGNFAAISALLS